MSIAAFIPCWYRPQNLLELVLSWEATTHELEDAEIYFTCASDDVESIKVLSELGYSPWIDDDKLRFVKRIQFMYENTKEDWFLTGADDIIFHSGWHQGSKLYMDKYSVISFEDLCNPNVPGTNFLIKRRYIQDYSGVVDSANTVFHQGYFHNYCDNELVETARKRDAFVKCGGVIEHMHPTVNKSSWDDGYDIARLNWDNDAALYNQRAALWS